MAKRIIITILAVFVVLGSVAYVNRARIRGVYEGWQKSRLPEAASYGEIQKKIGFINGSVETIDVIPLQADLSLPAASSQHSADNRKPTAVGIPEEFNLDVPFMVQAPYAVWDAIHEDACEEASVIMAAHFVLKKSIPDAAYAEKEILKMVDWEKKNFGFWVDTDAEKTAEILTKFYGLKNVEVKYDITIQDIKAAVAAGYPVILPAAGRELHNPYFRAPGPLYHMLVVKGYTADKIIVNDPGTKHGKDFIYRNDVLFDAIHDWNGGNVEKGKKVMIVARE